MLTKKVCSTEEEFSNQVDKMLHPVDSHPLSPAVPAIAQCAHDQNGRDS